MKHNRKKSFWMSINTTIPSWRRKLDCNLACIISKIFWESIFIFIFLRKMYFKFFVLNWIYFSVSFFISQYDLIMTVLVFLISLNCYVSFTIWINHNLRILLFVNIWLIPLFQSVLYKKYLWRKDKQWEIEEIDYFVSGICLS